MRPESQLGYQLVRAAEVVSRPWLEGLRAFGINPRQFSVLALIAATPELSQAELARRAAITPQSMGELLARLESSGVVARPALHRGKAGSVQITDEGRALLARAYPEVERLGASSVAALGPEQQRTLAELLDILITTHETERERR